LGKYSPGLTTAGLKEVDEEAEERRRRVDSAWLEPEAEPRGEGLEDCSRKLGLPESWDQMKETSLG
jgi:hypothetical protein